MPHKLKVLFNRLRGRHNLQHVLLLREDRNIEEADFHISKGFIVDESERVAWFLIHDLMFLWENKLTLLLSQRDAVPLDPHTWLSDDDRKKLADIRPIAREMLHSELGKIASEGHKDQMASALRFGITITALGFGVLVLLAITKII